MNKLFILSTIIVMVSFCDASAMEQNANNCVPSGGKNLRWMKYKKGPYRLKLQETNPDVRRQLNAQFEENKNNTTEFPFPTHKNL